MNIPQFKVPVASTPGGPELFPGAVVTNIISDLMIAGAYVLVLYIIVLLNRQKHVSVYVPKRTYGAVFGAVLAVGLASTVATVFFNAPTIAVIVKIASAVLMVSIAIAVWRVLPRSIDHDLRAHNEQKNAEIARVSGELDRTRTELVEMQEDFEELVGRRTDELTRTKLDLEKQVVERRLTEERVSESKRRLDELIMRTNTASLLVDADGTVIECNHPLAQMVGRGTIEELVGRKLSRLLGLRNEQTLVHFTSETLRCGTFACEFDAAPPARGVIHIEASGAASVIDGRPCVMALFRDVTERYNAEKELRQSREALTAALEVARKANATKSDFLAKMNHELRTPLNGIIGLSEILRHRAHAGGLKPDDLRRLTDSIHQSGAHLLSLVDDLLDLSRLDSGSRSFAPTLIGVRAEIEVALTTLASLASKKGIDIVNECDERLEWVVDQRAFKQIIINLVNNALKFSPSGSKVRVVVRRTSEAMALRIVDEGPGIAESDRRRILAPFGRGEFAESQKIDGVGLGLTIVSELLKLQGGRLTIESESGAGSAFTAIFPIGPDTPEEPAPVPVRRARSPQRPEKDQAAPGTVRRFAR